MSGFVERVIENWLTSADERGYQYSFAASLARAQHQVRYVSSHGPMEHGKDIITISRDGEVFAYQLKAGNISLAQWRQISDEVRDCARIPPQIPGVPQRTPDHAILVLTGRLTDTARSQIQAINASNQAQGYPVIETMELDELVRTFTEIFEGFFPASIGDFNDLVRLRMVDGRGPLAKPETHYILGELVKGIRGGKAVARALSNVVVATEFIGSPFRRLDNHISLIDAWVTAACIILLTARRLDVRERHWRPHLELCREAIASSSDALLREALTRKDLLEGDDVLTDAAFIGYRKTICLGYMAAVLNSRLIQGGDIREDSDRLFEFFKQQIPLDVWGEGAWNHQLNLALALQTTPRGALAGESIVSQWLKYSCPSTAPDPPDPYETVDDRMSIKKQRERATDVGVELMPLTYSSLSAVGYLARRSLRRVVAERWRSLSLHTHAQFVPDEELHFLHWSQEAGHVEMRSLPTEGSWGQLQREAFLQRSELFGEAERWLLPYFLCAYPHRTNPSLCGELDWLTAPSAFKREWERRRLQSA